MLSTMLLGGKKTLEDLIIMSLALKGEQTVKQILDSLTEEGLSFTEQGVYRVLRKLQAESIVVKEKKTYSLRIAWILDMGVLVEQMQETYLHDAYLSDLLPEEDGEKRTWQFNNVIKMHDFWTQLNIALAKQSKTGIAMNYSPHLWYEFVQKDHERQFYRLFLSYISKSYTVVGNKSFLDRYAASVLGDEFRQSTYHLVNPEDAIEKDQAIYIDVIDDYILTVKLDKHMVERIESLYSKATPETDLSSIDVLNIFIHKTKVKMTLRKDERKARVYRRKFERLFGPLG